MLSVTRNPDIRNDEEILLFVSDAVTIRGPGIAFEALSFFAALVKREL